MNKIRVFFASRVGRLAVHDVTVAVGAGGAAWAAAGESLTWGAAVAAGVVAGKTLLRLILPVPASGMPGDASKRVKLLPSASGAKVGALPSPRDERDYLAELPDESAIPTSVDNGVGIKWGMLLNDQIGDCYPAALLHAIQVLTGYTPVDGDALVIYEKVGGYNPAKTAKDGSNPTDNGTVGRQLYAWAVKVGLIGSYVAVPVARSSVRAAIDKYKVVLCEWALPTGTQTEGDVWTVPRSGKTAGSWGGHATAEPGYTSTRNKNVTWGEYGTVTEPFEDDYLDAAWSVTMPAGATAQSVAALMAKIRVS